MELDITLITPLGGILALLFALYLFNSVKKQSAGNEKMKELSNAIREGAMAFLKSEYKVLIVFVVVVAALLLLASYLEGSGMHWGLSVAFVIGAIFSAVSGNIGMRTATMANARTAEGTKKELYIIMSRLLLMKKYTQYKLKPLEKMIRDYGNLKS